MNYYQFHVGDYATHSRYLTLMQDLAYRRLLDLYYTTEQPIPLDVSKAARLIGMQDHIKDVSEILSDYFLKSDAGYINKRCDEEIERYKAKAGRAKKANETRWKSENDLISETQSDQILDLKSERNQLPTNNQQPITNNQHKSKKHMSADADDLDKKTSSGFSEFWSAYPRDEGKAKALKAWKAKRIGTNPDLVERIIADVKKRKAMHRPWLDGFVPHATTYINGERWEDQITTATQQRAPPAFASKSASAIMQLQELKNAIRERNNGGFGGGINRENGGGSLVCVDLDRTNSEDVLPGIGLSAAS